MTIEIIEKNPDKDWDWMWISNNPNLTIDYIEKNPDKPWDWEMISCNPNITIEIIEKYIDKPWDWNEISRNLLKKEYEEELKKLRFERYHEELIQKTWHPSRFQEWCLDEEDKGFHDD